MSTSYSTQLNAAPSAQGHPGSAVARGLSRGWAWLSERGHARSQAAPQRTTPYSTQRLAAGQTWVIERPERHELLCLQGSLWVTLDNDPRDQILAPGQCARVDRPARMLVHALADAWIRLTPAAA